MKLTQLTESLGLMCYINDDLLTFTRAAGNRKDQIEMFLWMMEGLIEFEEKKTVDDWFALEDEVEHVNVFRDGVENADKLIAGKLYLNLAKKYFELIQKK
jgi:hypothetical protein